MLALIALFSAQVGPQVVMDGPAGNGPLLLSFEPGTVRCAGRIERPRHVEPPAPVAIDYASPQRFDGEVRLRFRIAPDGRPLSISAAEGATVGYGIQSLPPALAVWRFAPGAERRDCELVVAQRLADFASAPINDVYDLMSMSPPSARSATAARQRIHPATGGCPRRLQLRRQIWPSFERMDSEPGRISFSVVGFDVDARGRTTGVRIVGGNGNPDLDRRSVAAIRDSRYAPDDARQGCTYPYWSRSVHALAAPPPPDVESLRPTGSTCRGSDEAWRSLPSLPFPEAFRRRRIEGWAVIAYDRAPWGATGNVRVLTAEPAAAFGEYAANIVRNARAAQNASGATGCVDIVHFRIGPETVD